MISLFALGLNDIQSDSMNRDTILSTKRRGYYKYEQVAQRATIAHLRTSIFLNSSQVSKRFFFQLVKGS